MATEATNFQAIKAQFPSHESLGFIRGAVISWAILLFGCLGNNWWFCLESNTTGVFRRKARRLIGTAIRAELFGGSYYVTTSGSIQDDRISDWYSVAWGSSDVMNLTTEMELQSRAKGKPKLKQQHLKRPLCASHKSCNWIRLEVLAHNFIGSSLLSSYSISRRTHSVTGCYSCSPFILPAQYYQGQLTWSSFVQH